MIHIALCLSIGFVLIVRLFFLLFFFDFCLCFHITFIVIIFFYIIWHIFLRCFFSFLLLFRLLLWSFFQKDTFLFIRGRLFICVVIIRIPISFISHIIFTYAHDAEVITLLTGNNIGDAGATQLAYALQRNSTLTTLNLMCKHDMNYAVVFVIFYLFSSSFYVLLHPLSIIVSHMGCFFAPFQYHCFTCVLLIIIFSRCVCWLHWKGTKLELLERRSWLMRFNATALSLTWRVLLCLIQLLWT